MNPNAFDSWRRIEALFYEALDVPAQQRGAFLDHACETPELRAEVESLLASAENTLGFLERPLSAAAERLAHDPFVQGTRIAAYQLIRSLGAGGMGTVYFTGRRSIRKTGRHQAATEWADQKLTDADALSR
jgi:hypothetical protein